MDKSNANDKEVNQQPKQKKTEKKKEKHVTVASPAAAVAATKNKKKHHKEEGRTTRSGLMVSVARMDSAIRDEYRNRRTDSFACVSLAAIIEEFVRMLVREAVGIVVESKKKRILGKTLHEAAKKNALLAELTKGAIFGGGGDIFEESSSEDEERKPSTAAATASASVEDSSKKKNEKSKKKPSKDVDPASCTSWKRIAVTRIKEAERKRKQGESTESSHAQPPQRKKKKTN